MRNISLCVIVKLSSGKHTHVLQYVYPLEETRRWVVSDDLDNIKRTEWFLPYRR